MSDGTELLYEDVAFDVLDFVNRTHATTVTLENVIEAITSKSNLSEKLHGQEQTLVAEGFRPTIHAADSYSSYDLNTEEDQALDSKLRTYVERAFESLKQCGKLTLTQSDDALLATIVRVSEAITTQHKQELLAEEVVPDYAKTWAGFLNITRVEAIDFDTLREEISDCASLSGMLPWELECAAIMCCSQWNDVIQIKAPDTDSFATGLQTYCTELQETPRALETTYLIAKKVRSSFSAIEIATYGYLTLETQLYRQMGSFLANAQSSMPSNLSQSSTGKQPGFTVQVQNCPWLCVGVYEDKSEAERIASSTQVLLRKDGMIRQLLTSKSPTKELSKLGKQEMTPFFRELLVDIRGKELKTDEKIRRRIVKRYVKVSSAGDEPGAKPMALEIVDTINTEYFNVVKNTEMYRMYVKSRKRNEIDDDDDDEAIWRPTDDFFLQPDPNPNPKWIPTTNLQYGVTGEEFPNMGLPSINRNLRILDANNGSTRRNWVKLNVNNVLTVAKKFAAIKDRQKRRVQLKSLLDGILSSGPIVCVMAPLFEKTQVYNPFGTPDTSRSKSLGDSFAALSKSCGKVLFLNAEREEMHQQFMDATSDAEHELGRQSYCAVESLPHSFSDANNFCYGFNYASMVTEENNVVYLSNGSVKLAPSLSKLYQTASPCYISKNVVCFEAGDKLGGGVAHVTYKLFDIAIGNCESYSCEAIANVHDLCDSLQTSVTFFEMLANPPQSEIVAIQTVRESLMFGVYSFSCAVLERKEQNPSGVADKDIYEIASEACAFVESEACKLVEGKGAKLAFDNLCDVLETQQLQQITEPNLEAFRGEDFVQYKKKVVETGLRLVQGKDANTAAMEGCQIMQQMLQIAYESGDSFAVEKDLPSNFTDLQETINDGRVDDVILELESSQEESSFEVEGSSYCGVALYTTSVSDDLCEPNVLEIFETRPVLAYNNKKFIDATIQFDTGDPINYLQWTVNSKAGRKYPRYTRGSTKLFRQSLNKISESQELLSGEISYKGKIIEKTTDIETIGAIFRLGKKAFSTYLKDDVSFKWCYNKVTAKHAEKEVAGLQFDDYYYIVDALTPKYTEGHAHFVPDIANRGKCRFEYKDFKIDAMNILAVLFTYDVLLDAATDLHHLGQTEIYPGKQEDFESMLEWRDFHVTKDDSSAAIPQWRVTEGASSPEGAQLYSASEFMGLQDDKGLGAADVRTTKQLMKTWQSKDGPPTGHFGRIQPPGLYRSTAGDWHVESVRIVNNAAVHVACLSTSGTTVELNPGQEQIYVLQLTRSQFGEKPSYQGLELFLKEEPKGIKVLPAFQSNAEFWANVDLPGDDHSILKAVAMPYFMRAWALAKEPNAVSWPNIENLVGYSLFNSEKGTAVYHLAIKEGHNLKRRHGQKTVVKKHDHLHPVLPALQATQDTKINITKLWATSFTDRVILVPAVLPKGDGDGVDEAPESESESESESEPESEDDDEPAAKKPAFLQAGDREEVPVYGSVPGVQNAIVHEGNVYLPPDNADDAWRRWKTIDDQEPPRQFNGLQGYWYRVERKQEKRGAESSAGGAANRPKSGAAFTDLAAAAA